MVINIVGGGPCELLPDLHQYSGENSIWVGVDRGVSILLENGIVPQLSFGDFDSVSGEEWEEIQKRLKKINKFLPEKDETDMELALNWGLEQKCKKIQIFGGTGGRLDHFFANVQLLLKPILKQSEIEVSMIDKRNELFAKSAGSYFLEKIPEMKYTSFIPLTSIVENLSLDGFKYPLTNCHIPLGSTLCISNELKTNIGTFSFTEGILLVVRSCD